MKSKDRLSILPREHSLQLQLAIAAFGCIDADSIVYISTPVTTGKRLYEYMKKKGLKTPDAAKADKEEFYKNVISLNIQDSLAWAKIWRTKTKGAIIAPAEFEKCRALGDIKWSQDAFMGMWLTLIDNKATALIMQDGWVYSDGAAEEYLQAICMQAGLRQRNNIHVMDTAGRQINLDEGIISLAEAFKDLHQRGLSPERLAKTLTRLLLLEERHAAGHLSGEIKTAPSLPVYEREPLLEVKKEVMTILKKNHGKLLAALEKQRSAEYTPLNILVHPEDENLLLL